VKARLAAGQAKCQAGHEREISDLQPINAHHCPQNRPTFAVIRQAVGKRFATLESIMMVLRGVGAHQGSRTAVHRNSRWEVAGESLQNIMV